MSVFGLTMTVTDTRRARVIATWPVDVPELGVTKGQSYNLAAAQKVWFTAKVKKSDTDAQAVIAKATDLTGTNDITFGSGATAGTAYFDIVPADTNAFANITRDTRLYADLQVRSAAGEVWTVAEGTLTLEPQVTVGG